MNGPCDRNELYLHFQIAQPAADYTCGASGAAQPSATEVDHEAERNAREKEAAQVWNRASMKIVIDTRALYTLYLRIKLLCRF